MKWPLYILFAAVISAGGVIVLSNGWNLPPPATDGRSSAALAHAPVDSESLPACCKPKPVLE